MPNPKRKLSKSRRDKRRTHYKAEASALVTCPATGTVHMPHRAYTVDGNLYYKGKMIVENFAK